MESYEHLRLSREIIPIKYELLFIPSLDSWTFQGFETIEVEVFSKIKEIRLHLVELDVIFASFNKKAAAIQYDLKMEQVILTFKDKLIKGKGILKIDFIGKINDYMRGFYRSMYKTENDDEVHMAITQFEPTDARRAFPCWDEPSFKSTFDLSLIIPSDNIVLSNMPEKNRVSLSNYEVKVVFERTPLMSTYLLAFAVGKFEFIESTIIDNLTIRVFTLTTKSEQGRFALNICYRIMKFYIDYFNIPYLLPKLDLIAIPDFIYNAMENWGLIVFRESFLLIDDQQSSEKNKLSVLKTVAHECAHMWFGNLVTVEWWNDIWLNEGFATWLSYHAIDCCYPEYDAWLEFAVDHYSVALDFDILKASHPIQTNLNYRQDIQEYFDIISYSKGACLIRMLNNYLTETIFRQGLNLYLKRFQFKNAVSENLWEILTEISGEPISDLMNTWIKQKGFPLITISLIKNPENHIIGIKCKQKRFSISRIGNSCDIEEYWTVPISFCSVNNPTKIILKIILKQNGEYQIFSLPNPESDYIRINESVFGFYHVKYDDEVMNSIVSAVKERKLCAIDRLGLLFNNFSLGRAGVISIIVALNFMRAYINEERFRVWYILIKMLNNISSLIDELDSTLTVNVNKYISKFLEPLYFILDWKAKASENYNDIRLRSLIISTLGKVSHETVVEESIKRFDLHYDFKECSFSPDLKSALYKTVVKHGGRLYLSKMLDMLKEAHFVEERIRILRSLGVVEYSSIPTIYEIIMSNEVKRLETMDIFFSTVTSAKSRLLLWNFVRTNFREICKKVLEFPLNCFYDFASEELYNEFQIFFQNCLSQRCIKETLENIDINIHILKRDGQNLKNFFS